MWLKGIQTKSYSLFDRLILYYFEFFFHIFIELLSEYMCIYLFQNDTFLIGFFCFI